ncbi:MAG: hypothetical protein Q9186_005211 [Xanthomendoza sp. 1 TL-2023]
MKNHADDEEAKSVLNTSDDGDNASVSSADSDMMPFQDYKSEIEQLLHDSEFAGFTISPIQHGYSYQNCVYGLTSPNDTEEQYILRVPVLPELDDNGRCEDIENDAALLEFLDGKLPVPRVKTFCSTNDNVLEKPYTIQTRLLGISLNEIYNDLSYEEKVGIVDQFVELLAKVESVTFATAGTFAASPDIPSSNNRPLITFFNEGDEKFMKHPMVARDRRGSDLKTFLLSHINGWIRKEYRKEKSYTLEPLKFMLTMIDDLTLEGAFDATPHPIVLHHWDLEPRNLMVEKIAGAWKIRGIIDWDAAVALPRPLARRAPDWIWDFDSEGFTGYLDNDHHPKPDAELSAENSALKTHFNAMAAEKLAGYLEDAYGQGVWLRRLWTFARSGIESMWYIDLVKELEVDWKKRLEVEMTTVDELTKTEGVLSDRVVTATDKPWTSVVEWCRNLGGKLRTRF